MGVFDTFNKVRRWGQHLDYMYQSILNTFVFGYLIGGKTSMKLHDCEAIEIEI